ncbi:MAG: restriction endonuclease [Planctomycetes bacterium GWA2_50_13]|nr:MAG: restriction endonuclease [Planctomycetes bacterium GWA2_50_13]OHB95632.1 MAG: restriction endonuclease [Planctomycetes bacterium RIFCSPLOWO2_02_FULL_50_16]OHC04664.1 MAG: restriction endonuclease [Planctomycetes bacterium RIFCSPLOWO2_12_FULL_50_35]HCN19125.1 restriction endonuclease [Planctomycetia bacterium]
MTIPDYQTIMLPLLKFSEDRKEHSIDEAAEYISNFLNLTEEERRRLYPSGKQVIFPHRVRWARTYLVKADLLKSSRRGYFVITDRGLEVLKKNPSEINAKYLEQFPEFVEFLNTKRTEQESAELQQLEVSSQETPQESLEYGYQRIKRNLCQELLDSVKNCSPAFFERLVVELLLKMGYGGSLKEAGRAIGRSGDGGIDGIINEDKLGLDVIYLQAKRWEGTVGRPEIQKFVGALHGQRARKGIFITTSNFSKEAQDYVPTIDTKIVLIDGEELSQLMFDNDIGVSRLTSYEIKKMDTDYFSEE